MVEALKAMAHDPKKLEPSLIVQAADSEDPELRILAIRTASASCYAKAAQLCLRLLFDEEDAVIFEAIRALEIVGDASALPHLRRLSYSEDPDIALTAMEAMRSLQGPEYQLRAAA